MGEDFWAGFFKKYVLEFFFLSALGFGFKVRPACKPLITPINNPKHIWLLPLLVVYTVKIKCVERVKGSDMT